MDAAWLHMDRPENTADVVAVLSFADRVPFGDLRDLVARKLLAERRFRQRVVHRGPLDAAAWEDDPHFSLDRHLLHRRIGRGPDALRAFVGAVATERLDPARPLWRVYLVDGAGAGSAVVAKLHHCIGDGLALVGLLLSLVDEPPPPAPLRPHRPRAAAALPSLASLERPWEAIGAALRDPAGALRFLPTSGAFAAALARMIALWPDPGSVLKRALCGDRRVAWSGPIPLRAIRAAARARGATVNDLLVTALAGALGSWLRASDARAQGAKVRALVPVNLRPLGPPATLGNAFGLVFLDLPLAAGSPDARLATLRARMQELRRRPDPLVTFGVLSILGRIPPRLERLVNAFFTSKASLVVTNVPGPRRRLHLAGHRLDDVMFWVPHPASLGLGVSILSYAGAVHVGVRADTAVMPDPAALVARFEAEVSTLSAGARPPRRARRRAGATAGVTEGVPAAPA